MNSKSPRPYHSAILADLTRQLLFAPPRTRIKQVRNLEALHDSVEPDVNYPLNFVIYRITGYRPDGQADVLLVGEAILPDLRLMIDTLSRTIPEPPNPNEAVETPAQLAKRLNVSTKTLLRWREHGLRWRWQPRPDGKKGNHLVYPRGGVERFLKQQAERVNYAKNLTHMSEKEKQQVIARARRIAINSDPVSLNRVATHLAQRTGRSLQAVRQVLQQHDQQFPENMIFADRTGPLTAQQKRLIWRAHRMGVSMNTLTHRFNRSRSTIYRAVNDRRASVLRRMRIRYFAPATFNRPDAHDVILGHHDSELTTGPIAVPTLPVADLPEALRPLYDRTPLRRAEQTSLLARYNFLKFCAASIVTGLHAYEPRASDLDKAENYLSQASTLRDQLVAAHLPLVLSAARRHQMMQQQSGQTQLLELLHLGNEVLADALETYDITREQTFSAYLTWLLMRQFTTAELTDTSRAQRKHPSRTMLDRILSGARRFGVDVGTEDESEQEPAAKDA